MKIAILVPAFLPKWLAGTEIATYNIARHLAKRRHEVHVITSMDKGMPRENEEAGFYVHRIGFPRLKFLGIMVFSLKALFLLKGFNPDLVHAQNTIMGMPGFLAKKLLRKPYLVWARGSEIYLPWLFKRPMSKLVLKNADAAIALTEDMKTEMQKICNRDVLVIPNGIDFERFENLSRDAVRCKLQANSDARLVIFVGRFRPEKGVRYLIEAMEIIRQKNQQVRLILGGEGPEEDSLRQLVRQLNLEDCVDFAGQIPNEKVPQYMAASDVFVLPSLSEGLPNVILEAMASGLPIVASKVGGVPQIIKDGENGYLIEPTRPDQIAEKVLLLLENHDLRDAISRNSIQKAKDYSWENVVWRLEEVYESCLSTKVRS